VLAGRTAVIVSHRVTAVMDADLILVVEEGRIVEQGTHAALLKRGGAYALLQRRQLLAETLAGDDLLAAAGDGV
jgi:ATP-binding cassette subfamily B protein